MKKHLVFCFICLAANTFLFPQNKVSLNLGYGSYVSNSENSLKIMGDERFRLYFISGLSWQSENFFGYNLLFNYSYHSNTKTDILTFAEMGEASPYPVGYFGGNLSLGIHSFELDYVSNISRYFSYGAGPSFVITHRALVVGDHLNDDLASLGLGVNAFMGVTVPLSVEKDYYFFTAKLKLAYTHSIWFDKGNRKLDNYNQDFLTNEVLVGIGYAF